MAASLMGSTALADTYYAVSSGGNFYVGNTGVLQTGAGAFHGAGSDVVKISNTTGYADAGIVLDFDQSLKLSDLNSLEVSSTGAPLSVNLWLDTGNDGNFFHFDGTFPGTNELLDLAGDSYGGHNGTSINASSSFYMFAGSGAGNSYSLTDLKNGVVPGIDGNTKTAVWIGLDGTGPLAAQITDVQLNGASITAVPTPATAKAGVVLLGCLAGFGVLKRRSHQIA
jgi:hypothetical protein